MRLKAIADRGSLVQNAYGRDVVQAGEQGFQSCPARLADFRRAEQTVVWLAFVTAARTRPELQEHARELYDGMRMVVGRVLNRARQAGRLRDDLDIVVESERLSVLLDGLAMNAVLQPDRLPPAMIRRVLTGHLDSLPCARHIQIDIDVTAEQYRRSPLTLLAR